MLAIADRERRRAGLFADDELEAVDARRDVTNETEPSGFVRDATSLAYSPKSNTVVASSASFIGGASRGPDCGGEGSTVVLGKDALDGASTVGIGFGDDEQAASKIKA